MAEVVIDAFCGAGGASLGIHAALPEATVIGIDHDANSCATHAAAGFQTLKTNINTVAWSGPVAGLWSSPPCTDWSVAGDKKGLKGDTGKLIFTGMDWARALWPDWLVFEEVPSLMPWWRRYATELRSMGYHVWTGILEAADYGLPQNRERAILLGSLWPFQPPVATHAEHPHPRLDGTEELPWVTMADALGWGLTARPAYAVCPHGQGGPGGEVASGGSGARESLRQEITNGHWAHRRPATTLTTDTRIFGPHAGSAGEPQSSNALKVTLMEMAMLQGFPANYPFQGKTTSIARQIGNAMPPVLAEACVRTLTGRVG